MFRLKSVVCVAVGITALALPATPAAAARPLRPKAHMETSSSLQTGPQLDGSLAAAGSLLCQSMPVSTTSLTELSCQALQQTVQSGPYPALWPMSQVIDATLLAGAAASPTAQEQYASEVYATLDEYADGLPFSSGLTFAAGAPRVTQFYDDNAWAGLDLLHAYQLSAQPELLQAAKQLLTFERTGKWRPSDPPDEQQYPGGIYWNNERRTRPALVAAAAAQLALQLYTLTQQGSDLEFGEREYDWVRQTLASPDGLFYNRVSPGGTITGKTPENGDALMIGDGVLLYQITGQAQYLDEATQTANATLARFSASAIQAACPAFNAILFRDLGALNNLSSFPNYSQDLDTYAAWVAQQSDPQTGVFPLSSFGSSCSLPMPQAGATATLILSGVG